jgi:hypothetical protein
MESNPQKNKQEEDSFINLVEATAQARGEPSVDRLYIREALRRINSGQENVQRYPLGKPSLKDVYDVAARLEHEKVPLN